MSRPLGAAILGVVAAGTMTLAATASDDDTGAVVDDRPESFGAAASQPDVPASTAAGEATLERLARTRSARPSPSATSPSTAPPPSTTQAPQSWQDAPEPDAATCAPTGRSVVVEKAWQRAWLCADGVISEVIPITTASNQPDPGTYPVYEMDYQSWSTLTGGLTTLDRFIAFTRGKFQGLRIGFHAVPYYADGSTVQPLDSVGDLGWFGDSSGCIRVLPDHAELLYGFLQIGDEVRVIS